MKENYYLRTTTKQAPDACGIEKALNSIAISDNDKENISSFLSALGYSTADIDGETKVFMPKKPIVSTWDVRAESKLLIAYNDLKDVCKTYLNAEVDDLYNEAEINEILYMASRMPSYSNYRSTAVKEAFFMFIAGRRLKDLELSISEAKETEENPDEINY